MLQRNVFQRSDIQRLDVGVIANDIEAQMFSGVTVVYSDSAALFTCPAPG